MSTDPHARRDTSLAAKLKARIRREGPIPVGAFMRACLHDPEHGYYVRQRAVGAAGDFVTAPEISQIFGELIGLWCGVVWQQMGSPSLVHLVELGPGRGTLMRDALRAVRLVPGFKAAARVTLVEINATLREAQKAALTDAGVPIAWNEAVTPAVDADEPTILLGNEFLDVLIPDQYVRRDGRWAPRQVGLDRAGQLAFQTGGEPVDFDHSAEPDAAEGAIAEVWHDWQPLPVLAQRCRTFAALLIDYGHTGPALGDTLQAVRNHAYEHPLTSPGEADVTAQVDFAQLSAQMRGIENIAVDGPVTQSAFLGALGIVQRASRLMAANTDQAATIEAGVARLMAPAGMGTRFKAIGLRSAHLPPLPGLA